MSSYNRIMIMEQEKKFFYDHFTESDVPGMFGVGHLVSVLLFAAVAALLLYMSRKATQEGVRKIHLGIAIAVTVMEVVKISLRVYKGQSPDSWVPLYYCSLFIFAVWISLAGWEPLARVGYAFITMGGCVAAVFFTLYPSTSLALYPIWHPATLHSFTYHLIMFYLGILILTKKVYVPKKADALGYFLFILAASVPSVFLNDALGTNCMFLRHAFKLPILEPIIAVSKYLYMAVVFLAQAVLMYWGNYLMYLYVPRLIAFIKSKRKGEKE